MVAARLENFQTAELRVEDLRTGLLATEPNAVIIRKLPEAQLSEREHQIGKLPLWISFDSSAGLLYRQEPLFQNDPATGNHFLVERFQTSQFMDRANFAPSLMSAFHMGGFDIVPRFGVQETFYGQSPSTSSSPA